MHRAALVLVAALLAFASGCSVEPADEPDSTSDSISSDQIQLPPSDECSVALRPLAEGVALSAWPNQTEIKRVSVRVVSIADERLYHVFVDGPELTEGEETLPNDHEFLIVLSNEASSKCFVTSVQPA